MKSVRLGLMTALLAGYLLHTKAQIDLEPSKIFEKVIFKGYVQLNILMVGQSGTGKTSCVNSLFNSTVIPKKDAVMKSTNKMTLYRRLLPFKHVDMDLPIIDTVGYGDSEYLQKEQMPIIQLLKDRLIRHKLNQQDHRLDKAEGRIHLVIYFLDAHRFKGVDLRFIKKIIPYAKVAVVISKADSLTEKERLAMRKTVKDKLKELNEQAPESFLRLDPYPVLCESRSYEMANFFWDDLPDLRADILVRHFETLDAYTNKVYTDFHGTGGMDVLASFASYAYFILILVFAYKYAVSSNKDVPRLMFQSGLIGVVVYYLFLYMIGATSLREKFLSPYFMTEVNKYPAEGTVNSF